MFIFHFHQRTATAKEPVMTRGPEMDNLVTSKIS
jgi:hypothetical protein